MTSDEHAERLDRLQKSVNEAGAIIGVLMSIMIAELGVVIYLLW